MSQITPDGKAALLGGPTPTQPRQTQTVTVNGRTITVPLNVPTRSDEGDQATVSFRVDPHVKREADELTYEGIATGRYPWKVPSDCYRAIFLAGLAVIDLLTGDDGDGTGKAYRDAVSHVDEVDAQLAQVRALADRIEATMRQYASMGRTDAAVTFLHAQLERVTQMPASPAREWLIDTLTADYEDVLTRTPAPANLRQRSVRSITEEARAKRRKQGQGSKVTPIRKGQKGSKRPRKPQNP